MIAISIPQTVNVRITKQGECRPGVSYYTETVDLKEYVKGVLPNEWLPSWDQEALRAGAVAVKNYAVSVHNAQGYLWDCNWNQVYNPDKRTQQTDRAVEDTWDIWLIDNRYQFVRTYYDDYLSACRSRGHECMSQYESQRLAKQGNLLRFIILTNYDGHLIRLYNEDIWRDQSEPNPIRTKLK